MCEQVIIIQVIGIWRVSCIQGIYVFESVSWKQTLHTDCNMFRDSFIGTEEYTTSVTGFINKCIDDVVPTVTIRTYPNQKPWITDSIRTELKPRAAAFKEQDSNPEAYKKSRYALRRTIKQAKRQY